MAEREGMTEIQGVAFCVLGGLIAGALLNISSSLHEIAHALNVLAGIK